MTDAELNTRMTEIMGWEIRIRDHPRPGHYWLYDAEGNEVMACYEWTPSTNIAQAMMVVDRMEDLGFGWEMGEKYVQFWPKLEMTGLPKGSYLRYDKREDRYRTICLAAAEAWEKTKEVMPSE